MHREEGVSVELGDQLNTKTQDGSLYGVDPGDACSQAHAPLMPFAARAAPEEDADASARAALGAAEQRDRLTAAGLEARLEDVPHAGTVPGLPPQDERLRRGVLAVGHAERIHSKPVA